MSDWPISVIAGYAGSIKPSDLGHDVVKEVERRVLDSLGCALGSLPGDAVRIARRYGYKHSSGAGARIWGSGLVAPPETATFVNGLMIRYLDFNDTYLSLEPLHPSDTIGAILTLSEYLHKSGGDLITSIAVAYEVGVRLCDAASLRARGWDHVNYTMIAAVAGLINLMELRDGRGEEALAIAIVPHASMRQTRVGELSMWKGAAAANSSRNAVFASLLAAEGFTGPRRPMEGEMGFIRQLLGGEMNYSPLEPLERRISPRRVLDTYMKFFPVEYHAQSAVQAVLDLLREREVRPGEVERIRIETFKAAYEIIVKDPEKWRPTSRETADHSLQYCVASTISRGDMWLENFSMDEISNPLTRGLIERTEVVVSDEYSRAYPEAIPNKVTLVLKGGERLEREVAYPVGHPKNPVSDEAVESKFIRLTNRLFPEDQQREIIKTVWRLERLGDVSELIEAITI